MATFGEIFNKFAFSGLVILALFAFVIIVQIDNQAPQGLNNNSLFNNTYFALKENVSGFETTSAGQNTQFNEEVPTPGFGSIVLFGIVSVGKTFSNMIFVLFGLIIKLPVVILGIDPTITSMVFTWLVIAVILGVWATYKLGG